MIKPLRLFCSGLFVTLMLVYSTSSAQEKEKPLLGEFKGTASVTNNGISLVPSFSLGDPAILFDLKFSKNKLSFEPVLRFSLEGKPWSFIFWFRYKAIQKEKFSLRIGVHPALNFRTVNVIKDGIDQELIQSRRYAATEIVPSYKISDKISIGMYYLFARGFDEGAKYTNFLVLNTSFSKLHISKQFYFNWSPQVYYLKSDNLNGIYVASSITLVRDDFPISLSTILNKAIDTEILPEKNFTWNLSLVYKFGRNDRLKKQKEKVN